MKKPQPKADNLVSLMDDFAQKLLQDAKSGSQDGGEPLPIGTRLDVFAKVSSWVGVRNRIEDSGDGAELRSYQDRIKAGGAAHKRTPISAGSRSRPAYSRRGIEARNPDIKRIDGDGGAKLEAIKSRLPRANDGDAGGDSVDPGGKVSAAPGSPDGRSAALSGPKNGHLDGTRVRDQL